MAVSEEAVKYRFGARLNGRWILPRGNWEYSLDEAKASALRTWPFATLVGVFPMAAGAGHWVHETGKGWRHETVPIEAPRDAQPATARAEPPAIRRWWDD